MIKSNVEKHTVGWLRKKSIEGLLDFSISIQRKEVWDLEHKSNLIGAILLGVPVESLLFEEDGDDGYLVLDGKQRSISLLKFLNNEFAISDKVKINTIKGFNIIGKTFSEFPEILQEEIKEYELSISMMRPLTEDERELTFFMRNQAISLTKVELMRVLLGSSTLKTVEELIQHEFLSKTNISKSAKNRYQDQQIVLECILLDSNKELGFSSKDISKFAEMLKDEGISEAVKLNVIETFDYLNRAIPEKCKNLRKIHIPMIYKIAQRAMRDSIEEKVFFEWLTEFFKDIKKDISNEYMEAVSSRSAELSNVRKRLRYINMYYKTNINKLIA